MPQRDLADYEDLLTGQTAVVTGANSGIGKGIAQALGEAGAEVVVNYVVNKEAAEEVVAEIEEKGAAAKAIYADVSKEDEVKNLFQQAINEFGKVDILINNAGIQRDAELVDMTLEQWQQVIDVNLTGQFLCAREAARHFKETGVNEEVSCSAGKIICISSVHDIIPWSGHCNYAASKGGVQLLMKTLAQELAPYKIRVNSISPGAIKTPINKSVWSDPKQREKMMELIPYDRIGETEDIGSAAVWLASDLAEYLMGTTLYVDGGMTCYPGFSTGG